MNAFEIVCYCIMGASLLYSAVFLIYGFFKNRKLKKKAKEEIKSYENNEKS